MESYQQQLKEQQAKLQKASKQAQEAAVKATAQQQVSLVKRMLHPVNTITAAHLSALVSLIAHYAVLTNHQPFLWLCSDNQVSKCSVLMHGPSCWHVQDCV